MTTRWRWSIAALGLAFGFENGCTEPRSVEGPPTGADGQAWSPDASAAPTGHGTTGDAAVRRGDAAAPPRDDASVRPDAALGRDAPGPDASGPAAPDGPRLPPETGHPRLFLRASDLPRLRAWASAGNPVYQRGLAVLAASAKADMDRGLVPSSDNGGDAYPGEYGAEKYAELFAFLSLVSPGSVERDDYAQRARTCLMYVMDRAVLGVAAGQPFRGPGFAVRDRSRWYGEAFALTVDWIYGSLTAADKATIRTVFARWIQEDLHATTSGLDHPEPVGLLDDPTLLSNRERARTAGNNYFDAHMRNLGLMALALDPADDPDGSVRGHLASATGAWLYMVDHLMRTDLAGGMPAEGFEYSPQAIGYVAQWLLALSTSGRDDPNASPVPEPQVVLSDNPFWDDLVPAYLHSLSPEPTLLPGIEWLGPVYQPAWYGDGEHYFAGDFIEVFGPVGLYDAAHGRGDRLADLRWIQTHLPPGGEGALLARARATDSMLTPILYFLLLDPGAAAPSDPRPRMPKRFFAPGMGRLLARTSWRPDATWLTYKISWSSIDHQLADGNQLELFRNGEWLTKERTGYGDDIGCSDYHNTLAIENDRPTHDDPGYRRTAWLRGSQWMHVASGDGRVVARSMDGDFVHVTGDATDLYNSAYEGATDVRHASRSIVWLPPDRVVVYDRAQTATEGRFKRFWLSLPAEALTSGRQATMTTPTGQRLFVESLLPRDAVLRVEPAEALDGQPAPQDPIRFRLRVEPASLTRDVRFLHVLEGADAGGSRSAATLVQSDGGAAFEGVVSADTAVLFPRDLGGAIDTVTYLVPSRARRHLVTGLDPAGTFTIALRPEGAGTRVTITRGGGRRPDPGGVLDF